MLKLVRTVDEFIDLEIMGNKARQFAAWLMTTLLSWVSIGSYSDISQTGMLDTAEIVTKVAGAVGAVFSALVGLLLLIKNIEAEADKARARGRAKRIRNIRIAARKRVASRQKPNS